jgi:hypothetical protein
MAYTPDYTPSDMPNIATDVLGEGGVQLKIYMPLLILAFVLVVLAGIWVRIRRSGAIRTSV